MSDEKSIKCRRFGYGFLIEWFSIQNIQFNYIFESELDINKMRRRRKNETKLYHNKAQMFEAIVHKIRMD